MRRLVTILAVFAVLTVLPAPAANAGHEPTVLHHPQPVGKAGAQLSLPVLVDGCWTFCQPITLDVIYKTPDGRSATIRSNLGSFPGLQPALVTIPGSHVGGRTFDYRIEARQDSCWFDVCHQATARSPLHGIHRIPLV